MVITGAECHVLIPEQRKPHRNVLHLPRLFKSVDVQTCQGIVVSQVEIAVSESKLQILPVGLSTPEPA